MALQLTGAFKKDVARQPAGAPAGGRHRRRPHRIDTATELLAYYPVQVEKFARALRERWSRELRRGGGARACCDAEERAILDEFLAHGRAIRAERARAAAAGERPTSCQLVRALGRRHARLPQARASTRPRTASTTRRSSKALEEGIRFVEYLSPIEAVLDEHGARAGDGLRARRCRDGAMADAARRRAAGAHGPGRRRHAPNIDLREGVPGHASSSTAKAVLPGALDAARRRRRPSVDRARPTPTASSRRYAHDGQRRLLLRRQPPALRRQRREGDGLGQARLPARRRALRRRAARRSIRREQPARDAALARALRAARRRAAGARGARSTGSRRPSSRWWCGRPSAARHFQPGPVLPAAELRGARAACVDGTRARHGRPRAHRRVGRQGEGPALARSCSRWAARRGSAPRCKPGEPVVLMGPTGTPTEIPTSETVLLAGGGLGNAVLFSIAPGAARRGGNRVLYFAGYKNGERPASSARRSRPRPTRSIWCCDAAPGFAPRRPQDAHFRRQHRAGDAGLRRAASSATPLVPLADGRPHHRHRLRPHDGGGAARRATACSRRYLKPEPRRPSAASTRRCSA